MDAPRLRCPVCGGIAFACKCNDCRSAHRAPLAGALLLPALSHAQEAPAYPECPASAQCVLLLLPKAYSLDAVDGLVIGGAIVGVYAAAYLWRSARKALGGNESADQD